MKRLSTTVYTTIRMEVVRVVLVSCALWVLICVYGQDSEPNGPGNA